MAETDLRFPIGRFEAPGVIDAAARRGFVAQIEATPRALRDAVEGLSARQLDTPYRPGGWTVRQVVHHLPDSHVNAYIRFKFALTEDAPTIKPYDEALWAQLPEAASGPIELSLGFLEHLHARWVACIRSLPDAAFERTFLHPDRGVMSLNMQLADYAWHGRHHVAHITSLAARQGWKRPAKR